MRTSLRHPSRRLVAVLIKARPAACRATRLSPMDMGNKTIVRTRRLALGSSNLTYLFRHDVSLSLSCCWQFPGITDCLCVHALFLHHSMVTFPPSASTYALPHHSFRRHYQSPLSVLFLLVSSISGYPRLCYSHYFSLAEIRIDFVRMLGPGHDRRS